MPLCYFFPCFFGCKTNGFLTVVDSGFFAAGIWRFLGWSLCCYLSMPPAPSFIPYTLIVY